MAAECEARRTFGTQQRGSFRIFYRTPLKYLQHRFKLACVSRVDGCSLWVPSVTAEL